MGASRERPILFSGPMVRAILDGRKTQTRRVMKPQPQPYAGGVHENNRGRPGLAPKPYIDAYCSERPTAANPRGMSDTWCWWTEDDRCGPTVGRCPYGQPGDRLWVRETFTYESNRNVEGAEAYPPPFTDGRPVKWEADGEDPDERVWTQCHYRATDPDPALACDDDGCRTCRDDGEGPHWRPSIFMPRWASRLTLEVVAVRVERLQTISLDDARAEGIPQTGGEAHALGLHDMTVEPGHEWDNRASVENYARLWDHINGKRAPWASNPWVWVLTFTVEPKEGADAAR